MHGVNMLVRLQLNAHHIACLYVCYLNTILCVYRSTMCMVLDIVIVVYEIINFVDVHSSIH